MDRLRQRIGAHIATQVWQQLEKASQRDEFAKGSCLLRAGQTARRLYFVEQGLIRAFYYKDDKEVTNWFAPEGDFVTSLYSFIAQKPGFEYIEALEATTTISISYQALHELYARFPQMNRLGRLLLEAYYVSLEERLISLQFHSARERYDTLVQKEPYLLQRANLGQVASYLGVTQETLSRIRGL